MKDVPKILFTLNFKPLRWFTNFEIHPCREDGGHIEQCSPEEAHFWSVYVHYDPSHTEEEKLFLKSLPPLTRNNPYIPDKTVYPVNFEFGGLDCICDCDTKEQAEEVKDFLTNLCKYYNGTERQS